MITGADLAQALREFAELVEAHPRALAMQIEPINGLRIAVSVESDGEPRRSSSAERMRLLRKKRREEDEAWRAALGDGGDAQSDTGHASQRDGCDAEQSSQVAGGLSGGPDSEERGESGESGKETGSSETDLTGHQGELELGVTESDANVTPSDARGEASLRVTRGTHTESLTPTMVRDPLASDVRWVFVRWIEDTGHHRTTLDRKRFRRIRDRLAEGKTKEELVQAIQNRKNSLFLMGDNEHGTIYDGIETLLRDAAQVDKLLRLTRPQVKRTNGSATHGAVQPSHGANGFARATVVR